MIRPISIAPALNGWTVQVGCQTLVFASNRELIDMLTRYLYAPEETEKQVLATAINVRHTLNGIETAAARGGGYSPVLEGASSPDPRYDRDAAFTKAANEINTGRSLNR